jgi:hypothetical protein
MIRPMLLQVLAIATLTFSIGFAVGAEENWNAELQGDAADAAVDSNVVGMSSDERDALLNAQADDAADEEVPADFVRNRRRFVMREIRFNSDWDCDPTAVPSMVDQFHKRTGMDAQALQPRKPLTFDDPELIDWPYVYMTAHNSFCLSDGEKDGLKKYLDNGGFLHADDCLYGNNAFGPSFHGEMKRVYPEGDFTPIEQAGAVIATLLKLKFSWPKTNERGLPPILGSNPFEGMIIDGHLRILYTPPDIGCMWEVSSPPTPSNPLGTGMHNMDMFPGMREAGYRMGVNFVLYAMTH